MADTPIPATEPVDRPHGLTAAPEDGAIALRWDPPARDPVGGYQVLRRRPRMGEKTLMVYVENPGSAATTWTDDNVTPGIRHTYHVNAIGPGGQFNDWSNYDRAKP